MNVPKIATGPNAETLRQIAERLVIEKEELNELLAVETRLSSTRRDRLNEALAVLHRIVDKWDAVLPSIQSAEGLAYVHGWRYDGPENGIKPEMDAARDLLAGRAGEGDAK